MKSINERVIHTNILNKYINKVIPQIMDILNNDFKKGVYTPFKLKNNGSLYKKYQDKINNIIGYKKRPKNIRCFLDFNQSSCMIKFDISYNEGYGGKEHSSFTTYIKDYVYLWTNNTKWDSKKEEFYIKDTYTKSFNKKPIKTLKQVLNVVNKTKKLNNKIELLNNKKSELQRGFNNYLNK